jgi:hypothetical protein
MRNTIKILGVIAFAAIMGFSLVACGDSGGGGGGGGGDPALTGTVSISGTAEVGQTLTAVTSALGGSGTISFQWKRNPATGAAINVGTGGTYIVVSADVGATITVTVTRAGYSGSKTGGPTATVALPALTGTVTISGTAELGETLTAVTTSLGGSGDISYQWKRNPAIGSAVNIGTDSTYEVQEADIGFTITVSVTRDGNSGSKTSDPTATVTDPNLSALSGTVSISGFAEVGQILTAVTTALGGEGTISYQWKRNPAIGAAVNIGKGSTYAVQSADIGATITVTVTRTGNSGSVSSLPTAVIPDPDATGTVSIGITAGGDITIDAADGLFRDGVLILTRLNNYDDGEVPVVITLANIADFDEDSVRWRVQNTAEKAGGSVFRLFASNPAYIIGNVYYLTVEASRNGVPYDYTISFMVEEE